jgi:alpha-L-fucosidase
VISHSLVGASPDYVNRFFETLPAYFDPDQYRPDDWTRLAKLADFRYVMFTAKHHVGFCLWNTQTTTFSVMHTPCLLSSVKISVSYRARESAT